MKNMKILKIRKKLDKLDLKMLSIIKKRSLLVNKILKQKEFKNQIIDQKRIKIILNKINNGNKKPIPINLPRNLCIHSHQNITLNSLKLIE